MTEQGQLGGSDGNDWAGALVAALPFVIFAVGIVSMVLISVPLDMLVIGGRTPLVEAYQASARFPYGLAAAGVAVLVLIGGALVAALRRAPAWGFTWIGGAAAALLTVFNVLADERDYLVSPTADTAILVFFLLIGVVAMVTAVLRGWREAGLLSIGFSATLGLSLCSWLSAGPFFRADLTLLIGPVGLLVAGLTWVFYRGSRVVRIVALVAVGAVGAGVFLMANQIWRPWQISHGQPASWQLLVVLIVTLSVGPALGLFSLPLRRVLRRA